MFYNKLTAYIKINGIDNEIRENKNLIEKIKIFFNSEDSLESDTFDNKKYIYYILNKYKIEKKNKYQT